MINRPLYHYTTQAGLLGIIRERKIWASNIHYLNDLNEFKHAIDLANTIAWHMAERNKEEWLYKFRDRLKERLEQISKIHIFVFSLSENGDQLSQWRGYCPSGSGYSIGFSREALKRVCIKEQFSLDPVIYNHSEKNKIINDLIENVLNNYAHPNGNIPTEDQIEHAINKLLPEFARIAPRLKDPAFSEENEWRLISGLVTIHDKRLRYRPGKSGIIPYLEIDLNEARDSLFQEVVVGPTPEMYLATNAVSNLMSSEMLNDWSVKCSQIPYRHW